MNGKNTPQLRTLRLPLDLSPTGVRTKAKSLYSALTGQCHTVSSISFDRRVYDTDPCGFEVSPVPSSRLRLLGKLGFSWGQWPARTTTRMTK